MNITKEETCRNLGKIRDIKVQTFNRPSPLVWVGKNKLWTPLDKVYKTKRKFLRGISTNQVTKKNYRVSLRDHQSLCLIDMHTIAYQSINPSNKVQLYMMVAQNDISEAKHFNPSAIKLQSAKSLISQKGRSISLNPTVVLTKWS